ncbi:chromosome segregation protein SMC [candidate division WOR-3 bacterium]|nr:chromosome segregation protein SMC [candidate division WOR-3 bacterium]
MKLNRLEILGFKSFPTKTKFGFDSGIVAIVGPNGCGKTNILDAIEWVLGEQNPYKLRGEKMEDFIFKGSLSHKPLNFAEVTAVIENDDTLPISYQEVAITRRYYRSGESEYLINRSTVRRKDIVDLFLNTGLKAEAYSIFRREMIDTVLSSTSKTRRSLFEEAAEIAKYKSSKKSALDKLELTNTDLLRVNDILQEVNSQWRSLKRQVRRVIKYKEIKEEIKSERIKLAHLEYIGLEKELSHITDSLEFLEQKRGELLDSLEVIEAQLREMQDGTKKINETISQAGEEKSKIQTKRSQLTKEIIVVDERKKYIFSQKEYLESENTYLEEKNKKINEIIDIINIEKNNTLLEIERKEIISNELKKKISSLEETFVLKKEDYENALRKKEDIDSRINSLQVNQISQTADSKNREESRISIISDIKELEKDNENVEEEIAKLKDTINQKKIKEAEIKKKIEDERIIYNTCEEQKKEKEKEVRQLKERKNILKNENGLLKIFSKEKEGYNELIKTLKKELSLIILPEILDTPEDIKESLLGVLESFIETVVLDDPEKLSQTIDFVKNKEMRIGILLAFLDIPPLSTPADKKIKGPLSKFLNVKAKGIVKDRIKSLLSRYLLVDTIDDAIDLQKEFHNYSFVTKTGDVLTNGNLFTGKGIHRELIGISKKIKDNVKEIDSIENSLKKIITEKEKIEKEAAITANRLEEHNKNFSSVIASIRKEEITYEKKLFEKTTNEKRIKKIKHELEVTNQGFSELTSSIASNERLFREENEMLNSIVENSLSKEESFREVEAQFRSLRDEYNNCIISLTKIKGEKRANEEVLKSKRSELDEINSKIIENAERITSLDHQIVKADTEKKILYQNHLTVIKQLNNIETTLNEALNKMNKTEEEIERLKIQEKEVTENEKELFAQLSNLNLDKVRIDARRNNLIENVKENYDFDLKDLQEDISLFSKEKIQEELEILDERIRKFGPINLMAEEDLDRIGKRKEDLITQKTDLQEAQKDLLKTIEHIDTVAKEKFLSTFNEVRKNFKTIFSKLFESGECDLILSEGDPLEAGIKIVAKPKHKKVDRLEALSTGERTLIAIALLFSFYLIKPSPICVLDEIDAPLDDANIERFLSLLEAFKKKSQLIVITHNKITMEAADYLYGITMSEPNVSTVASVKIS